LSPAATFRHLKHVYWNVHWQARFAPPINPVLAAVDGTAESIARAFGLTRPLIPGGWTVQRVAGANSATVGRVHDGNPNDRRFTGVLTAAGAPHCNTLANNAGAAPNILPSRKYEDFNVKR